MPVTRPTAALFVIALLAWGCVPPGGGGGGGDDDRGAADAASTDGRPDGAPTDAGPTDAGPTDAGPTDAGPTDAGPTDTEPAPDVPPAAPGAPRILSLDSDVRRLTEGQGLRISAVVTDDDGPEDVLGGVLEDPMGGSYGAFTATGGGTYQVDVDWAALHRVMPIEFVGEVERTLWARFFDQAGLETVGSVRVTLFCAGGGACDGACLDVRGDPSNCGGCGTVCPAIGEAAPVCVDGRCAGACPGETRLCGEACIDPDSDPAHCGGCDTPCPAIEGGEATCVDGQCGGVCPGAAQACGAVCVDVRADVQHCGRCGNVCPGGEGRRRCVGGECLAPCAAAEQLCDGACVDVNTDPAHCGGCDDACVAPDGGEARCVAGDCVDTCPAGLTLCGDACVDIGRTDEHCGRCDNACIGDAWCSNGRCRLDCAASARACDGRCVLCPESGLTFTCREGDCVITSCVEGDVLIDGVCERPVVEVISNPTIFEPQPGAYPTIGLDLTTDAVGRPYLMVGRVRSAGGIYVEAGARDREAGWRFEALYNGDAGRRAIRVGAVRMGDGRIVHGWVYDRRDRGEVMGGGMQIGDAGDRLRDLLPDNAGGNVWGFSVAGRIVDGQMMAQMGLSLDNPVNRSMTRYDWQGELQSVDPFIDGIVHFTLDAAGAVHFVYQPDYGGDLTWRRGVDFGDRVVEAVGEPAALLGGVRVGPRGPVVSYAREPDTRLRVATREGGRWTYETVDPAALGGQFWGFDVELDANGWPVVCYWREAWLYTARLTANGWQRERVAQVFGGQTECAVTVDGADRVAVAWAHFITQNGRTTATLKYYGLSLGPR